MKNHPINNQSCNESKTDLSYWQGWLFGFYKNKGINLDDASDLVQNVLIKIHTNLDAIEAPKMKSWVTSVATNELTDYFRQKGKISVVRDQEEEIKTSEIGPEQKMENQEEINQLKEFLSELSPNHFEVLDLYYFQNLTKPEIAKKLNIPLGTVKSRIFSALEMIKNKYK